MFDLGLMNKRGNYLPSSGLILKVGTDGIDSRGVVPAVVSYSDVTVDTVEELIPTYTLSDDQTFAEFFAAETLVAGDIVDGNNETYLVCTLNNQNVGTESEPLQFQNISVDGESTTERGIQTHNNNNNVLVNISTANCTGEGFYTGGSIGSGYKINNISDDGSENGVYLYNKSDLEVDGVTTYNQSLSGIYASGCVGTIKNILSYDNNIGVYLRDGTYIVDSATIYNNSAEGFLVFPVTLATITCTNISVDSAYQGIDLSLTGGSVSLSSATKCTTEGFLVNTGCSDLLITDNTSENNLGDGFSNIGSSDISYLRNIATGNGLIGQGGSGDAFTSHIGCLNNKFYFNFSKNNLNTAHAHIDTSSGEIFNHTSYNDGDVDNFDRAVLCLTGTGTWVVKNSVFCNLISYPIAKCGDTPDITADHNCYISDLATPFVINGVSDKSFTEWITAIGGETNSIFIHYNGTDYDIYYGSAPAVLADTITYCPITENGLLVIASDNPLIDGGSVPFVDGDGTQYDLNGVEVWNDDFNAAVYNTRGAWFMGAYAPNSGGRVYNSPTLISGSGLTGTYTLPICPTLLAADDGTIYTSYVPNQIDLSTLVDSDWMRSGTEYLAAYSENQDANAIVKIDKYIGN